MTLEEWKEQMAERFTGRFDITTGGRVRHDTRTDVDNARCCPIIAFAFDDDDFVDASNRCADLAGIALGLDPDDVGKIMDAADGDYGPASGPVPLRKWMETVLVHGKAVDA